MRGGLPRHPSSNVGLDSFIWDVLELSNRSLSIVSQKESLEGASHYSQRGKTSTASRLGSLYEGAVMNRKSKLSQRLILAVTSDA